MTATNPPTREEHEFRQAAGFLGNLLRARAVAAILIVVALNVCMLATPLNSTDSLKRATADANHTCQMNRTWPWWIANGFFKQQREPDVLVFGSSLVNAALWTADAKALNKTLDCIVHRRSNVLERKLEEQLKTHALSVVNCSISGAMASDDYVMAKALLEDSRTAPKLFVIGIAPRDFIDSGLPDLRATDTFRFFSRYIKDDSIKHLLYPTLFARISNEGRELYESLPIRKIRFLAEPVMASAMPDCSASSGRKPEAEGGTASGRKEQSENPPAIASADRGQDQNNASAAGGATGGSQVNAAALMARARLMGATGSGHEERIEPGLALLPAEFPDVFIDNSMEYAKRYRKPFSDLYKTEMLFFEKFLALAKEKGAKVLVVGMPLRPENRALLPPQFWQDHHQKVDSACTAYGATFFNIFDSDSFKQADFVDTVHLNTRGANKLLSLLSEKIANTPAIAQSMRSSSSIAQSGAQQ